MFSRDWEYGVVLIISINSAEFINAAKKCTRVYWATQTSQEARTPITRCNCLNLEGRTLCSVHGAALEQQSVRTPLNFGKMSQLLLSRIYRIMKYFVSLFVGGNKLEEHSTLQDALLNFKGVFMEKTGNEWEKRKNFTKQPKLFNIIEIDYLQDTVDGENTKKVISLIEFSSGCSTNLKMSWKIDDTILHQIIRTDLHEFHKSSFISIFLLLITDFGNELEVKARVGCSRTDLSHLRYECVESTNERVWNWSPENATWKNLKRTNIEGVQDSQWVAGTHREEVFSTSISGCFKSILHCYPSWLRNEFTAAVGLRRRHQSEQLCNSPL